MRPVLFWSIGISMLEMLMKLGNYLSGWLGILMNLKLVVMPLLCAKFAIVLTTPVLLVPIVFLMKALLDLAI